MSKSVYIRAAVRELLGGQMLLGFSDHETNAILTWQKIIGTTIDGRFPMLFALFTRLNSAFNRFKEKSTVEQARRSERIGKNLLKRFDKWREWEDTRRDRYKKKLRKEKDANQDLPDDKRRDGNIRRAGEHNDCGERENPAGCLVPVVARGGGSGSRVCGGGPQQHGERQCRDGDGGAV